MERIRLFLKEFLFSKAIVTIIVTVVIVSCVSVSIFMYSEGEKEYKASLASYRAESRHRAELVQMKIETMFEHMYFNLRTIGRLPSVRTIERHAETIRQNDKIAIQEIYNNLVSSVAISEVYILPKDFNPHIIDPITGKLEEPILVFDNMIVGRTAEDSTPTIVDGGAPTIEETEIYEYYLMEQQLAWMKQNYPLLIANHELEIPAISGKEVITCDNSRYSINAPNDADRSGLVYSVPFYDIEGQLHGMISGIFLTQLLRELMPDGDYVLMNAANNLRILPNKPSKTLLASLDWIDKGLANPNLIYSDVIQLSIIDHSGKWVLWVGISDEVFFSDRRNIEMLGSRRWGIISTLLFGAFIIGGIFVFRNQHFVVKEILVSEKKGVEAELRGQMNALNKVQAVIEFDLAGTVVNANQNFLDLMGYTLQEVIGKNHSMFVESSYSESPEYQDFWNKLRQGESQVSEFKDIAKDGKEVWIQASYNPIIDEQGKPYKIVEFATDITERMQFGDKLQKLVESQTIDLVLKKEEAEKASQAKSEFLSNMSHELRTPMHAVLNYAKMGLMRIKSEDPEIIAKYFANIQIAGKRLLGLLNNLLDIAKMESGKMVFKFVQQDFVAAIEHTLMEMDSLLKEKQIHVVVENHAQDTNAYFDKEKMIQVFVNLLSNAIKFSHEKSTIHIRICEICLFGGGVGIYCSVADEGDGIPDGELEAVFDKFIQSSKTKSGAGGTGLGLSICREIVESHGGKIWASNWSGGAEFSFIISKNKINQESEAL